MATVIKGGTVVDAHGRRSADVAIEDGRIVDVGENLEKTGAIVLDATGCYVSPGLVDVHVHAREPGFEDADTIETVSRQAVLGGYTAFVAMPNTKPAIDSANMVRSVRALVERSALCDVAIAGAITVGREGKVLAPFGELYEAGVRIFTDDGSGVQDNNLMRHALEYASMFDVVIVSHCEDESLSHGGHMHEGAVSSELGVQGIPAEAEELMVMREIALARTTGGRVHLQHCTTAGVLAMYEAAKAQGLRVSAEITPHHFTLTDESLRSFDPNFKVNPPLRDAASRDACRRALEQGIVEIIATDHAPHAPHKKELPLDEAAVGMLGLETAFALSLGQLNLPIERLLAALSWNPAHLAQLDAARGGGHGGPIVTGAPANLTVLDPNYTWTVDRNQLASKSHNTPYHGMKLRGRAVHTIVAGEVMVRDGVAQR